MNQIKAIIFDMDGVLIDAREWHYKALNRALELFGYTINRYEHLFTYDGLSTRKKLEILSVDHGLPRGLHAFINKMKQIYTAKYIFNECQPVFQHEYALAHLKKDGYKLAVASNSIRRTVELMMERSLLRPYLEFLLSNEDVTNSKPHPEIYTLAIQKLGLRPAECLIIEDNENGKKAALKSGAHLFAVGSPMEVNYTHIRSFIEELEACKSTS